MADQTSIDTLGPEQGAPLMANALRDEIKRVEQAMLNPTAARLIHELNNAVTVLDVGLRLLEGENDAGKRASIIADIRRALHNVPGMSKTPAPFASTPAPKELTEVRRVLVVEDGDGVAGVACHMLGRLGYAPVRVGTGAAALDLLAGDQDFMLVFSDVMMPGMNGMQLAREIEQRWPALPVLLTSGFSGENFRVTQPFLPKPYDPNGLVAAIDEALRAHQKA